MSAGRVPEFFIVGHGKSGTTAMYEMLSRHPQVFMPDCKEPWFFAEELYERMPPRPEGTPADLAEYMALFAPAGADQMAGEATALYLWSHTAAERIARERPDARIIAILREPASFLRSLHRQWLRHYVETETDFRRALELEQPRREGLQMPLNTYWPKALFYSDHVRYVNQLRRFHERFARERVLVLIYDDYRRDNDATVRSVLRFLDVDDSVPILARQSNESVHVQSPRVHAALRRLTVADSRPLGLLKRSLRALTPMAQRQRLLQTVRKRVVFGEPAPADEELLLELRHRFKPEVAALSEYLDRDLVGLWGYDELS
jgi:hypothetical protein